MPEALQGSEELQGVRGVLLALWEKDYVGFHKSAASRQWGDLLSPLMGVLSAKTRDRVQRVVSRAYTTVSLDTLVSLLACTRDEGLRVVAQNSWAYDPATGTITIGKGKDGAHGSGSHSGAAEHIPSTSLSEMTKYVIHLDANN